VGRLSGMRFAVRVDASVAMGTGHLMRCLTLAGIISGEGASVDFVCSGIDELFAETIRRSGHGFLSIESSGDGSPFGVDERVDAARTVAALNGSSPDWVVVDHYGLSAAWEQRLRAVSTGIMVIDDLADREHDCDVLLDQNLHTDPEVRYAGLVPDGCRLLLGPTHALLRGEFLEARARMPERDGTVRRILVFMGGSDPGNTTGAVLEGLCAVGLSEGTQIDVVVGIANPHADLVHNLVDNMPGARFLAAIPDMASMLVEADLAIGAGGIAAWERCFIGVPTLIAVLADNQEVVVNALTAEGATRSLGRDLDADAVSSAVQWALEDSAGLCDMSRRAMDLMGVADESRYDALTDALTEAWVVAAGPHRLRRMDIRDRDAVYCWRMLPHISRWMLNDGSLDSDRHQRWFQKALASNDADYFVYEYAGRSMGLGHIDRFNEEGVFEWGFYVGEENAPAGAGTTLCGLLLNYAFECRNAQVIRARVLEDNAPSMRIHEKMGFSISGGDEVVRSKGGRLGLNIMQLDKTTWDERRLRRMEDEGRNIRCMKA